MAALTGLEQAYAAHRPAAVIAGDPFRAGSRIRQRPYLYGTIVCMKKTLHVDERLLREARAASRATTDTETIRLGLEALVRRGAYERLRALRGSEPKARDTARRRERVSSAKHSAA